MPPYPIAFLCFCTSLTIDFVVGMVIVRENATLLTVCSNGYGKRTDLSAYRTIRRGGQGVINIQANKRNGWVVSIIEVVNTDELMIITSEGMVIRLRVKEVRTISRNTQGVRMIKVNEEDYVVDVCRVAKSEEKQLEQEVTDQKSESVPSENQRSETSSQAPGSDDSKPSVSTGQPT